MKPFLSIRWKILIPLVLSLLGAHLAIFFYINGTLVTQYESARAQLNDRNIRALEGSLSTSFLKQLELAQTLSLVAESDSGAKLERVQALISARFSYFETMGMLDTVALYQSDGVLLEQWGDTDYRYDPLVSSALQYEYPVRKLHCTYGCYRYLAVPLLNSGQVVGVIVLGRAVHDLVVDTPIEMLHTPIAVYIGIVYSYLPFMVLPLYATLIRLDDTLLEAAADLGCPPWKQFLKVTWPLSLPGVLAGAMLVFIPVMGEFVIPDLLGGPDTLMIGKLLWTEFFANKDWPLASALAAVLLCVLIIPFVALRHFERRAEEGI
jgi:ABC-type molybdate transport system permease subunit